MRWGRARCCGVVWHGSGSKEGKEKDQQNQQASIWASSSSSSVLQLELQQMAKTKELEETMEESKSKAGGLKRHATRSTNFLSWSNSNIKCNRGFLVKCSAFYI